jgi:hypothetical protein
MILEKRYSRYLYSTFFYMTRLNIMPYHTSICSCRFTPKTRQYEREQTKTTFGEVLVLSAWTSGLMLWCFWPCCSTLECRKLCYNLIDMWYNTYAILSVLPCIRISIFILWLLLPSWILYVLNIFNTIIWCRNLNRGILDIYLWQFSIWLTRIRCNI